MNTSGRPPSPSLPGDQQEINCGPRCSRLRATPAFSLQENSGVASLTLPHSLHKTVCRGAAAAGTAGRGADGKSHNRKRRVCCCRCADALRAACRALGVEAGRKGGNGSLPLTMSCHRLRSDGSGDPCGSERRVAIYTGFTGFNSQDLCSAEFCVFLFYFKHF